MNLREAREKAGLSRDDVAFILKVTFNTVRRWELGENRVPADVVPKLQKILKLSDREAMNLVKSLKKSEAS